MEIFIVLPRVFARDAENSGYERHSAVFDHWRENPCSAKEPTRYALTCRNGKARVAETGPEKTSLRAHSLIGTMPYVLTVGRQTKFLHVKVTGHNTPQTVKRYLTEVGDVCLSNQCRSVLIEENLEGPSLGTFDIFAIVSEGSNQLKLSVDRIAYVDLNRSHDPALMRFAVTVAINRGVNVRLFENACDAETWLGS